MTVGCGDTITNHYANREKAEEAKLFERGWLPSLIPLSAMDITTTNDLDINISEGEFKFDLKETNEFIKNLMPFSNLKLPVSSWQSKISILKKNGYDAFEYTSDQSVWIFVVNNRTGHARYMMWSQNAT